MIIFLYGNDDYRREARKRAIIEEFKKRHSSLGVGRFDFEEEGGEAEFREFVANQSMFDPAKLAVLEHALEEREGKGKRSAATLKGFVERKETTLLVNDPKKPVKAFDFLLKKPALTEEYENLEGAAWKKYIANEAARRGAKLSAPAVEFLGNAYAGDTWRLITELDKLSFLGKGTIEEKDLAGLDIAISPEFWPQIQRMVHGTMRDRVSVLESLFATNEPAQKVFAILSYQNPRITDACALYDIAIKSGKLDYEEALVDFATS